MGCYGKCDICESFWNIKPYLFSSFQGITGLKTQTHPNHMSSETIVHILTPKIAKTDKGTGHCIQCGLAATQAAVNLAEDVYCLRAARTMSHSPYVKFTVVNAGLVSPH